MSEAASQLLTGPERGLARGADDLPHGWCQSTAPSMASQRMLCSRAQVWARGTEPNQASALQLPWRPLALLQEADGFSFSPNYLPGLPTPQLPAFPFLP